MSHAPEPSVDVAGPPPLDVADLSRGLAAWLPGQRWYAGKGREVAELAITSWVPLTPTLAHLLIEVRYTTGVADRYQVPLTHYADAQEQLEQHLVAEVDGRFLYDGLHDVAGTSALLTMINNQETVAGVRAQALRPLEDLPGKPVGVEQSNTSLVYGDAYILKLFRRLSPGTNPDLEITRALAAADSPHVAAPLGWIEGALDGRPTTLALLQEFLRSGTEGWRMALASVRDLYAEGDLHADEVGGDFAGESERLGAATAEVHNTLAHVLAARRASPAEVAAESVRMIARLDAASAAVDALGPYADGLREVFERFGQRSTDLPVQRIHGDYHLGQVMRVDSGWVLLDFEGEPARPIEERSAPASPLRDIAGMLRSYDYAARYLLLDRHDAGRLGYRAEEWAQRNRSAFCDGYAAAIGVDPRDEDIALRAFELDKAVYEVMYEARHRPSWLTIPLTAIERLVG